MGWLRTGRVYKLTKENLAKVPNGPGNYTLYNKDKKPVYVGTTKGNVGAKWGKEDHQRYTLCPHAHNMCQHPYSMSYQILFFLMPIA